MTRKSRRLLQARVALALKDELGRVPSRGEIDRYARIASVLFKSVGGVLAMKSQMRKRKQLPLF